jgi:hypothetical protein
VILRIARTAMALGFLLLALHDPAFAQAAFEPKALKLPPALWAGSEGVFSGQLSARVSMRKVKYARLLAERALSLPGAAATWPGAPDAGGVDGAAGVRRVELIGPDSGLTLAGFNEARLDYLTDDPGHPGCLGFEVELAGKDGGSRETFVSDPLETVNQLSPEWADGPGRDSVPVARANWVAKGPSYQLARILDREPDPSWHTSQDGPSTFVQRRFHRDLMGVGAADVVLAAGQDVQVNLVVSLDPAGKGRTVLDWYAIPKRTFDLGDGRQILRLYLGRYLRETAPGVKAAWLKEIALMFYKRSVEDVERERSVEKILFVPSGLPPSLTEGGLPRNLPARASEVFTGRGELSANLQELVGPPWKGLGLNSLAVVQSAQDPGVPFAQTLESARLADVAPRRDVPALLAATAERCASFGAPCDIEDPNGLVGQTPLWSLDFSSLAESGPKTDTPGSMTRESGTPVFPELADKLLVSPGRLSFSSAADGLHVECQGSGNSGLVLETGTAFTPEPGREYSFWLELGRARQSLAGVTAEAYGAGRSVSVAVKPGFPAVFADLPAKVEGVRLKFTAGGPDMSLTLRRAVLQSYDPHAPRQNLFTARYLFDESRVLKATAAAGGESLDLEAAGPSFPLRWLLLDVSVSPWTVRDQPPRLELSVGDKKTLLALPAPSSRLAVYLPALAGDDALPAGQPWPVMSLRLDGGAPNSGLDCSRAVLAGTRLATWPEVLGGQTLLELAHVGRTLTGLDAAGASEMAASAHWLSMGRVDIPIPVGLNGPSELSGPKAPAGNAQVRFARNPWLEVKALLVSQASGPGLMNIGEQAASSSGSSGSPTTPGRPAKWPAALALAALFGLIWVLARKGLLQQAFATLVAWLKTTPSQVKSEERGGQGRRPLSARTWLLAVLTVPLSGLVLGPETFRLTAMLGTILAIPFWRALRPSWARRFPRLARNAALHYCVGVLAAAVMAAAIRLAGAAPIAELIGLCGLWLFCAALVSDTKFRSNTSDPAGSAK